MDRRWFGCAGILLATGYLLGAWTSPALGKGESLAEATALRQEATAAWNDGRYDEGAKKLRRAAEIYRRAEGDYPADLAVVLRALTWHLVKAVRQGEARDTFAEVLALRQGTPSTDGEMWLAYRAMWEAARAFDSLDDAVAFLTRCRTMALDRDLPLVAAQVLHDLGSIAREKGARDRAIDFYEQAIAERKEIDDVVGATWTQNNLANILIEDGRLDDALPPLLAAWRTVHEDGVVAPQAAVATNVKTTLGLLAKETSPGKKHRTWLWTLAEVAAKSEVPEIVPSATLLRRAALADVAAGSRGAATRAARRVMKHLPLGQPSEVEIDLTLFAAGLALADRASLDADRWLKKLEILPGPLAAHLEARATLARALVAGSRGKKKAFARDALATAEVWRSLGDRPGRVAALTALLARAQAFTLPMAQDLEHELGELRRSGVPGGPGSSATGGGDHSGYAALGPRDPLFEVSFVDGKIRLHDLVADRQVDVDVLWQPRRVGMNGLTITYLGGWVRIESLAYGGAAVATGVPPTMPLETFEPRWPVPGEGALRILKNGAVTWQE